MCHWLYERKDCLQMGIIIRVLNVPQARFDK
jgi:hypothetical protein